MQVSQKNVKSYILGMRRCFERGVLTLPPTPPSARQPGLSASSTIFTLCTYAQRPTATFRPCSSDLVNATQ